jgi:pimeloyl-ACP methyl ester carboxylesterase
VNLDRRLVALIDDVPRRINHPIKPHVFLIGFSRGAQLADRFAFFHPDLVARVASLSAGTYTVPSDEGDIDGDGQPDELPMPFGTADMERWFGHPLDEDGLRRVSFWVCVGGDDVNPADLPRQWDTFLGSTRVARAQAFQKALQAVHIPAQLMIVPGAKHQLTAAMAEGANAFLTKL